MDIPISLALGASPTQVEDSTTPSHSVIVDLDNGIQLAHMSQLCSHMSDTSNQIDPRSHNYIGKRDI